MQNQKTTNAFTKKIGKATYQVKIHFSQNSKQTFSDKVLRLVRSDVAEKMEVS
jgi:hypothetical protein